MRQRLAVALIGVLALFTLAGLGLLVHVVAEGGSGAGRGLIPLPTSTRPARMPTAA